MCVVLSLLNFQFAERAFIREVSAIDLIQSFSSGLFVVLHYLRIILHVVTSLTMATEKTPLGTVDIVGLSSNKHSFEVGRTSDTDQPLNT